MARSAFSRNRSVLLRSRVARRGNRRPPFFAFLTPMLATVAAGNMAAAAMDQQSAICWERPGLSEMELSPGVRVTRPDWPNTWRRPCVTGWSRVPRSRQLFFSGQHTSKVRCCPAQVACPYVTCALCAQYQVVAAVELLHTAGFHVGNMAQSWLNTANAPEVCFSLLSVGG